MTEQIHNAFGRVSKSVAPHTLVRRWDTALLFSAAAFAVVYITSIAIARLAYPTDAFGLGYHAVAGLYLGAHYLTLTMMFTQQAAEYGETLRSLSVVWPVMVGFSLAVSAFFAALLYGLKPTRNMYVIDGPRVLTGKDAIREAKRITALEVGKSRNTILLHPLLRFAQERLNRHILIYGSVGSGKTQILIAIIRQIIRFRKKMFAYDVKGDFTSYEDFSAGDWVDPSLPWWKRAVVKTSDAVFPRPIILSPYDKRSYVWDVACDIHTAVQVEEFAKSMIPEETGSANSFFTNSARMLVVGALRTLIAEMPKRWTFKDLSDQLSKTAVEMQETVLENYKKAFPLIENAESQTTSSIMSTIMSNTQAIDYLAAAWPAVTKRRFSIVEWSKDSYRGRKQVIVQGGGMELLTSAYISAMVNILVGEVISPKLPDNTHRGIYIIFDELTSAGRLNILPLVDKGRSKGVTVIAGIQELSQLAKVYSPEDAKILPTIVGTQIICQLQMSETRKQVAEMFGTNITATLSHDENANVHQDGRQVVFEHQLTNELGPRKLRKGAFEVRAIVASAGYNPLLLAFPGQKLPVKRPGQIQAKWVTEPAAVKRPKAPPKDIVTNTENVNRQSGAMTQEEIQDLFR